MVTKRKQHTSDKINKTEKINIETAGSSNKRIKGGFEIVYGPPKNMFEPVILASGSRRNTRK